MFKVIITIHIMTSILICILVLLQHGKGANIGSYFSGGNSNNPSNSIFGSRGSAPFMFKFTFFLILIFFITSISLNFISKSSNQNKIAIPSIITSHSSSLEEKIY